MYSNPLIWCKYWTLIKLSCNILCLQTYIWMSAAPIVDSVNIWGQRSGQWKTAVMKSSILKCTSVCLLKWLRDTQNSCTSQDQWSDSYTLGLKQHSHPAIYVSQRAQVDSHQDAAAAQKASNTSGNVPVLLCIRVLIYWAHNQLQNRETWSMLLKKYGNKHSNRYIRHLFTVLLKVVCLSSSHSSFLFFSILDRNIVYRLLSLSWQKEKDICGYILIVYIIH